MLYLDSGSGFRCAIVAGRLLRIQHAYRHAFCCFSDGNPYIFQGGEVAVRRVILFPVTMVRRAGQGIRRAMGSVGRAGRTQAIAAKSTGSARSNRAADASFQDTMRSVQSSNRPVWAVGKYRRGSTVRALRPLQRGPEKPAQETGKSDPAPAASPASISPEQALLERFLGPEQPSNQRQTQPDPMRPAVPVPTGPPAQPRAPMPDDTAPRPLPGELPSAPSSPPRSGSEEPPEIGHIPDISALFGSAMPADARRAYEHAALHRQGIESMLRG